VSVLYILNSLSILALPCPLYFLQVFLRTRQAFIGRYLFLSLTEGEQVVPINSRSRYLLKSILKYTTSRFLNRPTRIWSIYYLFTSYNINL